MLSVECIEPRGERHLVSKCKVRGQGRKRSTALECTIAEYHVEALSIGWLDYRLVKLALAGKTIEPLPW